MPSTDNSSASKVPQAQRGNISHTDDLSGDPIFGADVDQLMDVMDSGGIEWYVMNFGTPTPLFLSFNFRGTVTLDALDAAQRLKRRFDTNADLRAHMADYALASGQAFHEFVAAGNVWRTPDDETPAPAVMTHEEATAACLKEAQRLGGLLARQLMNKVLMLSLEPDDVPAEIDAAIEAVRISFINAGADKQDVANILSVIKIALCDEGARLSHLSTFEPGNA